MSAWQEIPAGAPWEVIETVVEELTAQGVARARAQLAADPDFTPPLLALALAKLESELRAHNTQTLRTAWLRLQGDDEPIQ